MKLIVNHKGEQSLIVTKPDAAVLKKARGLIRLAATFYGAQPEVVGAIVSLIDNCASLANKDSADGQHELLEAREDDPPAVA